MKKTILLAFLCIAAIACDKKDDSTPQPELGTVSVPYRQSTKVSASGTDLKVELKEITDSRCPINADCISMGSAKLVLTISDASNAANVNFEFSAISQRNAQEFKLGDVEYVLSVTEVLPYPQLPVTTKLEDYKIGVSIERK
ncbi:hypothetical protein GCM10010967_20840 [Dyadobacter beijingensis]|uniref:Lipoprotein n=1 Tax=Dyadobacter beijingensis TaxID=365489 RepID=A0ABQ2HQQ0_9BACT|nr:hypothetical protein [Dyadobacter beijingensis]GGM88045.1 hypothetical protein GCM10010967_20840 [Dyadobacter beijingensis]